MSGILTVKTKVVCGESIEEAAKEMGLKYQKDESSITVEVSNRGYGSVRFDKNKQGTFTAHGDTMRKNEVEQFVQACQIVAVRQILRERKLRIVSEPGLRNLAKNQQYRIQALPA